MTYHDLTPGIYFEYSAPGENYYAGITQVLKIADNSACFTDLVCFSDPEQELASEKWYYLESIDHLLYEPLPTSDLTLAQLQDLFPEHFI